MDNQDSSEEMEQNGVEEIKKLLRLNRSSADDQLAAFREELDSRQESFERFKTLTEGAVDSGVRLAAEAESKAGELEEIIVELIGGFTEILTNFAHKQSNFTHKLSMDLIREKQANLGLNALTILNTQAVMIMSYYGNEEFSGLRQRYLKVGSEIQSLIIQVRTAEDEDVPQVADRLSQAVTKVFNLIIESSQRTSLP